MSGFSAQSLEDLHSTRADLIQRYQAICDRQLSLDITRGKPSPEQLDLSSGLLERVDDFFSAGGTDCRNYGGLDGLPEARKLFGDYMGVAPEEIVIGGNSSLNLMYDTFLRAMVHGVGHGHKAFQGSEVAAPHHHRIAGGLGADHHGWQAFRLVAQGVVLVRVIDKQGLQGVGTDRLDHAGASWFVKGATAAAHRRR